MLPNGLVWVVEDPKPPKEGFCPNREEPPNDEDEELPKPDVEEAPKAGTELPNAGDDEAPNTGVEGKGDEAWFAPNTPVAVPPKRELPVCPPNGVVLPKGFGANGLPLPLLVCPKPD